MKVHIALVGGQNEPVVNGIDFSKPDVVYLIHSADTLNNTRLIEKEVTQKCILKLFEPTNLSSIYSSIADLKKELSDDDTISLNLTSGTKHWSVAFLDSFRDLKKASIIMVDQNHKVFDISTLTVSAVSFDMDAVFRLNGNPLAEQNYYKFSDYTDADFEVMRKVESIRFYKPFFELAVKMEKTLSEQLQNNQSGRFEKNGGFIEWSKPDSANLHLFRRAGEFLDLSLNSPNAVKLIFNSGWFEYKMARMISHWRYASDVRTNCIFPPRVVNGKEKVKNEVDIIVNIGTKILFIECKTKLTTSLDIDKFRTAVRNYGGMACKALLLTEDPLTEMQKEKCRESNIITFSIKENLNNPEQELFKLLEQERNRINA